MEMKQAATREGLLTKHALHVTESMHVTYSRNRRRHMRSGGGLALADVVHGVGQLKGAGALWRAEDVAPLIADVADDDEPSVLQLLPLAGLVGRRGAAGWSPRGRSELWMTHGCPWHSYEQEVGGDPVSGLGRPLCWQA